MSSVAALIRYLQTTYDPADAIAAALWSPEDVIHRAQDRRIALTQEQATSIIEQMANHHDAELGLTWATIDFWIDDMMAAIPPDH